MNVLNNRLQTIYSECEYMVDVLSEWFNKDDLLIRYQNVYEKGRLEIILDISGKGTAQEIQTKVRDTLSNYADVKLTEGNTVGNILIDKYTVIGVGKDAIVLATKIQREVK